MADFQQTVMGALKTIHDQVAALTLKVDKLEHSLGATGNTMTVIRDDMARLTLGSQELAKSVANGVSTGARGARSADSLPATNHAIITVAKNPKNSPVLAAKLAEYSRLPEYATAKGIVDARCANNSDLKNDPIKQKTSIATELYKLFSDAHKNELREFIKANKEVFAKEEAEASAASSPAPSQSSFSSASSFDSALTSFSFPAANK